MITEAELAEALSDVLSAPKDRTQIDHLTFRPGYGQREHPEKLTLTRDQGVPGERWLTAPWLKLADGSPDPDIQVSILPLRVMELVWRDRSQPHPGDTIVADLDCSVANLPPGTVLQAGTARLRVSSVFNDACVKWKVRYGTAAKDWITAPGHPELRLRGVLCSVMQDGEVKRGDDLAVVARPD
ncbi:hypothetical protein [Neotabrizicola sp. sgz301269]|uniref:hypothetical protein n=1 Tax=Neotabrizicola sp. sgz301269 TaxID=3276282 RepID=UPI00376FE625